MKRFMLYVFAQDGADVDGALVTVGKNLAQLWLKFRGAFWATKSVCGDRLCSLTLCDFTPDFFSGPPEDFEDEVLNLLDSLCIEVPEDIGFPEEERGALCEKTMRIYEDGIVWEAFVKYTDILVTTAVLGWDKIEAIANEPEPKNNNGHKRCWWCGKTTTKVPMFNMLGDECPSCKR